MLENILFIISVNSFRNWLILSKMQSLNTNAGFYSVTAGQRVQMQGRPAQCRSLGVYVYTQQKDNCCVHFVQVFDD